MITPENIGSHELVGLETRIIQSTNPQVIGSWGKIIYETKSMLLIDTTKGAKMYPKKENKWEFSTQGKKIILDGKSIDKRPQDRVGRK